MSGLLSGRLPEFFGQLSARLKVAQNLNETFFRDLIDEKTIYSEVQNLIAKKRAR